MKKIAVFVAVLALIGCGGGGGTSDPTGISVTETIGPGETTLTASEVDVVYLAGTFNPPAPVTQTEHEVSPEEPTNLYLDQIGPSLTIRAEGQALLDPIAYFPDPGGNIGDIIISLTDGVSWYPAEPTRTNGKIAVTLPRELIGSSGGNAPITGKLTAFLSRFAPVNEEPEIRYMAGPPGYSNTVILGPGFADSLESFEPLATRLKSTDTYGSIYGIQWDWTEEITDSEAVQLLVTKLSAIFQQTGMKNVDIIAHSRSGHLVRYALEKLGATAAVRNCFFVCTPHEGSQFGQNASIFVEALRRLVLNTPYGLGWPRLDTPAVHEMLPGSQFLSNLNSFSGQTGRTNYYLFAAQNDEFVETDSALAVNTPLEELTGGIVERITTPGGHSYLVKNPEGISLLINKIKQVKAQQSGNVIFNVFPTVADPFNNNSWRCDFDIYTISGEARIIDMMLELYDAFGEWVGTWWVDPNTPGGEFFPTAYTPINVLVDEFDSFYMGIDIFAGLDKPPFDEAPPNRRRQTVVMTIRYEALGMLYTDRRLVSCRYNGEMPANPQTRAPHGPTPATAGGFSPVGK